MQEARLYLVDQPVVRHLPQISPADEFNQELVRNVHPLDWVNPRPNGRYNLVVIGAGTAGLVTAAGAAGLGAKVALIEQNLEGVWKAPFSVPSQEVGLDGGASGDSSPHRSEPHYWRGDIHNPCSAADTVPATRKNVPDPPPREY